METHGVGEGSGARRGSQEEGGLESAVLTAPDHRRDRKSVV